MATRINLIELMDVFETPEGFQTYVSPMMEKSIPRAKKRLGFAYRNSAAEAVAKVWLESEGFEAG